MARVISNGNLKFDEKEDGRITSTEIERAAIKLWKLCFPGDVEGTQPRDWRDFIAVGFPGQFKASGLQSDNFGNCKALAYVFTNIPIEDIKKVNANNYVRMIRENLDLNSDRDYPIIVFNKKTKEVRVFWLTQLVHLVPNPSNLPFQINWKKEWNNPSQIKFTKKEAYERIIKGVCFEAHSRRREIEANNEAEFGRLP